MSDANPYGVLGIARDASQHDIRAAFVRLVKRHHPDAGGGTSTPQSLIDGQEAYRVLSDPTSRADHDRRAEAAMIESATRQRILQRRLRSYDRRHPHRPVPRRFRLTTRQLSAILTGAAIAGVALVMLR